MLKSHLGPGARVGSYRVREIAAKVFHVTCENQIICQILSKDVSIPWRKQITINRFSDNMFEEYPAKIRGGFD